MQWACTYSPGATDHHISAARYAHTMPTLHPLTMPGPTRLLYGSEIRDHLRPTCSTQRTRQTDRQELLACCIIILIAGLA